MDAPVEVTTYPGLDERISILRAGPLVDAVFVRTRRFNVLVDTLDTPARCRAALRALGEGAANRPLLVVNSHMDWDHFWGNAGLDEGVPIIAHEEALRRFHHPSTAAKLRQKAAEDARFAELSLRPPTITFSDRLRLDGGDLTLELFPTPGHTPDHVAVWIPELRTCLAVDAVERPIPKVWGHEPGGLEALLASFRRIRDLDAEHVVLAHGQTSEPGVVGENLAYFAALSERVTCLEAGGVRPERLDLEAGFRLSDLVEVPSDWPDEDRAFYEGFHRANLQAVLRQHRGGA